MQNSAQCPPAVQRIAGICCLLIFVLQYAHCENARAHTHTRAHTLN